MSESPPTLLDAGGPLLSMGQFMLLMAGAEMEGLPLGLEADVPDDLPTNPAFRRDWQDLLAAIALFGPARVVMPAHLAEQVMIEPLLELDIAEILIVDTTADLRQQIARTYREAFERCRKLEQLRPTAPIISIDAPRIRPRERAEAVQTAGDAEYYMERLRDQVSGLVTGLQDIFGYYVESLQSETHGVLSDYAQLIYPDPAKFPQKSGATREWDLFHLMGLYIRGAAEVSSLDFEVQGAAYSPTFLEEFDRFNRLLTSVTPDFSEFATLGVMLNQFRRDEFLAVHAFWSSFYELTNMLSVSKMTSNPLFLPSAAPVRVGGGEGLTTAESLRVYRLFLSEVGRLPSPASLKDLQQLRRDPGLGSLRPLLAQWTSEIRRTDDPDPELLTQIHADIGRASQLLKQSRYLSRAGALVTLLSLPIALYDLLNGSALGTALTPVGPAIQAYQAKLIHQASWVRLGNL
jgi:hypothetical protein